MSATASAEDTIPDSTGPELCGGDHGVRIVVPTATCCQIQAAALASVMISNRDDNLSRYGIKGGLGRVLYFFFGGSDALSRISTGFSCRNLLASTAHRPSRPKACGTGSGENPSGGVRFSSQMTAVRNRNF